MAARADSAHLVQIECAICSCFEPQQTAHEHHITPRSNGGGDEPTNLVWLCASCHTRLHRIEGHITTGKPAKGIELARRIFPTNDKARGRLWEYANIAALADIETREALDIHKVSQKVTIEIDIETWNAVKVAARDRKMSANRLVIEIIKREALKLL